MDTLFSGMLTVSIQAAIAALVLIFAKKLFINRINLRIGYLLWVLVLIRLLFPILPASPASIFNVSAMEKTVSLAQIQPSAAIPGQSRMGSGSPYSTETDTIASAGGATASSDESIDASQNNLPPDLFSILAYIWAAGAIMTGGYYIFVNAVFAARVSKLKPVFLSAELVEKLKAKTGVKRQIEFVESPDIASPCVFGVVQYKIMLPAGMADSLDEKSLSHILTHELAHIKHWDLPVIWLSSLLCSLHWFNPVLWYGAAMVKREQELCADALVMSLSDEAGIAEYGKALISFARSTGRRRSALITAGITENGSSLKARIKNIASFSNKKYRITALGLLAIVLAGVFICTSRMDYPRTAEELQGFDKNILLEVLPDSISNPGSINLKVHNKNTIPIHSCELAVFNGNPGDGETSIFDENDFSIKAGQAKSFHIDNIDLKEADITFKYSYGISLDSRFNSMNRAGNLMALDRTPEIRGFAAPTDAEIADFIKEESIVHIAFNRVYNLYCIIMYENGNVSGYYELYKNTKVNKVESSGAMGIGDRSSQPPVSTMGGTASGIYPFTCIKINDPDLVTAGAKMELRAEYGTKTMPLWGARAYAVETRGYGSIRKILIYDKDDKLLYESEEFPTPKFESLPENK